MKTTTRETWTLKLTRNELIALAKAIALYIQLLPHQPDSDDKATTYLNLCRVIAKMPDDKWFGEEVRP